MEFSLENSTLLLKNCQFCRALLFGYWLVTYLLGFEFKKTVTNAIEDLCDAFEKKIIKDSFSDEWSNIKVLTKIEENKNKNKV